MTKTVTFNEVVTVFEFISDKLEKREDRMANIITMLDQLFTNSEHSDSDDEKCTMITNK